MLPERDESNVFQVVFLCTGNRARSPLAAELLKLRVRRFRVSVSSAGTLDLEGRPALAEAVAVGKPLGADLSGHRSSSLRRGELRAADLIVGFEPSHVAAAVSEGGAEISRAFMILELPELLVDIRSPRRGPSGIDDARQIVEEMHRRRVSGTGAAAQSLPDPYGKPRYAFVEMARVIDALTSLLATEICALAR